MLENSKVILSKNIKVDREMKNVLSYSPTQLINLMTDNDHLVAQDNHCSFIKERGTLQIDIDYSIVLGSNYVAYQNSDYSNKWFFAWIDEVLYKGDNNTEIVFTVDPFETFYSDLDFENAYVIREHVNDDTIGANTIPEDIDVGEITCNDDDTSDFAELGTNNYLIAIQTTAVPESGSVYVANIPRVRKFSGISVINSMYSGRQVVLFTSRTDVQNFIDRMNKDQVVEMISDMYIVPSCLFTTSDLGADYAYNSATEDPEKRFNFYYPPYSTGVKVITKTITKNRSYSGYTPKNNKVFCYPWNYLEVSNNIGGVNIYKYEDFSTNDCNFDAIGVCSIGSSFKLIPKNYKGILEDFGDSMALAKFPVCSWSSDSFTAWLTQSASNEISGGVTSIVQGAVAGASTGGGQGAVIGAGITAAGEVLGFIDKFDKSKLIPNQVGGSTTGDVNWAAGRNNFVFRKCHAKVEYLRMADNYLTRFGYKVNRLKTPNITGRRYFNYVQIASSDDVASGSIPQKYMKEINDAFRKGITIWHDHNLIGNYSVSNTIV